MADDFEKEISDDFREHSKHDTPIKSCSECKDEFDNEDDLDFDDADEDFDEDDDIVDESNTFNKKTLTGRVIPVADFHKMQFCLRCGLLGEVKLCSTCKDLEKCNVCGIVLREGEYTFYFYDEKDIQKKDFVKEFKYKVRSNYPPIAHDMCSGCVGWKDLIKHNCRNCGEKIHGGESDFKANGNFCHDCANAALILSRARLMDRDLILN